MDKSTRKRKRRRDDNDNGRKVSIVCNDLDARASVVVLSSFYLLLPYD